MTEVTEATIININPEAELMVNLEDITKLLKERSTDIQTFFTNEEVPRSIRKVIDGDSEKPILIKEGNNSWSLSFDNKTGLYKLTLVTEAAGSSGDAPEAALPKVKKAWMIDSEMSVVYPLSKLFETYGLQISNSDISKSIAEILQSFGEEYIRKFLPGSPIENDFKEFREWVINIKSFDFLLLIPVRIVIALALDIFVINSHDANVVFLFPIVMSLIDLFYKLGTVVAEDSKIREIGVDEITKESIGTSARLFANQLLEELAQSKQVSSQPAAN